jgi:drug/metabolite transporter (DMT)-like permease
MTVTTIERSQSIKWGVLYGVVSAFSFALMSVFVKLIGKDLPTSMLIFFRFGTSLVLISPWLLTDNQFIFKIHQPFRYVVRILSALLALFCIFYVIKFIPLVDALLLNNTAPLFVPIIAFILTGAKTPKKAIIGIILGFIGVGIILNPGKEIFSSSASLIALASGILAALAIVQMRLISKTSSIKQMLFYYFLVSTLVAGVLASLQWQMPENFKMWLFLFGIGIFGTAYQVFATLSYVKAPVRLMSPLVFLVVVFGGLFDWLLWDNVPTLLTIIGAILVITGALVTVYFGHKEISTQRLMNK